MELNQKRTKNIGYLRRLKERLEFKISTEASTLESEKDLVRRVNEVDKELQEAIKSYRLKKKVELIVGDIAESTKKIEEQEAVIQEQDKKLDELYAKLRKLTGMVKRQQMRRDKKPMQEPRPMEVSLADIAIIKEKKNGDDKSKEENKKD